MISIEVDRMNKVFISRADGNIPWGFRLQGGLEDNAPLTLTNVSVYVYFDRVISNYQSSKARKQLVSIQIKKRR